MNLAEAAVFLAQQWPCFPCGADKRPVTEHGFKDAERDPDAVRRLFARPGARLIGVPTGADSDLAVVDLDVKDGAAGLEWLAANEHRMPRTRRHRTRSGGLHLLFRYPAGRQIRNSQSKIGPGIDVRGEGGYIIAPPSDGYSIDDDAMPAVMPDWLVNLLDPPQIQPAPRPAIAREWRDTSAPGSRYGMRALEDEAEAVMNAAFGMQEGTLNNAGLKLGGLAAGGELDPAYARETLIRAALAMPSQPGKPAWSPAEVRAKAERAFADGQRNPRHAPPREIVVRVSLDPPEPPPRDEPPPYWAAEPVLEPEVSRLPKDEAPKKAPIWVDAGTWDAGAIPKRPWAVPSYLMRGSVSVLTGQGAGGKSSLVVAWTIACATGEPIGNFEPRAPMVCVNYNVEDDREEQQRRYSAALAARGLDGAEVMPRIVRCGPHDLGMLFERDPMTGRIGGTNAMQALERICMESEAEVLVCDPLAELHNAEENDNTAMRAVVAAFRSLARRLDISVLLLHHNRKGSSTPGDMDQMRGASAISGAVRVVLTLAPMTEDEADKLGVQPDQRRRHFRVDGGKSNYAPPSEAEWWKLAGYEIGNGETVAACLPWEPPSAFGDLSMSACVAILSTLNSGRDGIAYAAKKQAGEDWAGRVLTAAPHSRTDGQASAILASWVSAGVLVEGDLPSPRRGHTRRAYSVNTDALQEMRRQIREGISP